MQRIGILTGGGDAPGLNAAIKSVVYRADNHGVRVVGILDGWKGLLDGYCEETRPLDYLTVRTWDRDGGTNLGSSRTNLLKVKRGDEVVDATDEALRNVERLRLDGLVVLGGDDTLGVAAELSGRGLPVVGIPKTIDKDILGTDYTLGFDTAVENLTDVIEHLRTSAGSHRWVQVIEAMGRHTGHLAFWAGVAGAATIILVPEVEFSFERVARLLTKRFDRAKSDLRYPRYAVIVAAEGAVPADGDMILASGEEDAFGNVKLGGIGDRLARWIKESTPFDSRSIVPAHSQRGGAPTTVDRIMGALFGSAAVDLLVRGRGGRMVSARGVAPACRIGHEALEVAAGGLSHLDADLLYDRERLNLNRAYFERSLV